MVSSSACLPPLNVISRALRASAADSIVKHQHGTGQKTELKKNLDSGTPTQILPLMVTVTRSLLLLEKKILIKLLSFSWASAEIGRKYFADRIQHPHVKRRESPCFQARRASSTSGRRVKDHRWARRQPCYSFGPAKLLGGERVFSGRFPEPPATRPPPTAGPQQPLADTTASVPRCTRCFSSPRSRPMAKRLAAAEKEVGASPSRQQPPDRAGLLVSLTRLVCARCSSRWCGSRRRTA